MGEFTFVVTTIAGLVGLLLVAILHIVLAQATANDVDRLRESGREPHLLGSIGWALFVLVTGFIGVGFYWVMHYSAWRDQGADRQLIGRRS